MLRLVRDVIAAGEGKGQGASVWGGTARDVMRIYTGEYGPTKMAPALRTRWATE